jgi:hypothetical protein
VNKSGGAWSGVIPLHYVGDDANGPSNDNEAHLSRDLRTLYFSSDRSLAVKFPRTLDQAKQDLARLQSWDDSNYNAWFMPLAPLLDAAKNGGAKPRSSNAPFQFKHGSPVSFPRSQEQARRDLAETQVWANGRENIWYVSLDPWLKDTRKP